MNWHSADVMDIGRNIDDVFLLVVSCQMHKECVVYWRLILGNNWKVSSLAERCPVTLHLKPWHFFQNSKQIGLTRTGKGITVHPCQTWTAFNFKLPFFKLQCRKRKKVNLCYLVLWSGAICCKSNTHPYCWEFDFFFLMAGCLHQCRTPTLWYVSWVYGCTDPQFNSSCFVYVASPPPPKKSPMQLLPFCASRCKVFV